MSNVKQSEVLFLWDVRMSNPNGDMLNDNAPRYDETDRKAIVSDVRIKRTIRDDMQRRLNETIFVNNPEKAITAEDRFNELKKTSDKKDEKEVFLSCIDNRLFGGVAPKSKLQIIGAVQFTWSKSLNRTEIVISQGTAAFGTSGSSVKSFRMDHYIPYGLFASYATVNRLSAQYSEATEEDLSKMFDALWMGTKLLNTRSKTGQKPRVLIRISYKDDSMIGLLDELVKLRNENSEQIRTFEACEIDMTPLKEAIEAMGERVDEVRVWFDESAEKVVKPLKDLKQTKAIKLSGVFSYDGA